MLTLPFLAFWAFLGLKLSGAWVSVSWWWVFAPLWGAAALAVVGAVLGVGLFSVLYRWIK